MNTPVSQCHASLGTTQYYSAACQTHIHDCTVHIELDGDRQGGRQRRSEEGWMEDGREQGEGGWEQGNTREGGREGAMMIGRERASVEEGRVEGGRVAEGNERGRDGPRHGRHEGKRGGRKRAEDGLSKEGREQGREGNFKGGIVMRAMARCIFREPGRSWVRGHSSVT